jgi:hypothetical protein
MLLNSKLSLGVDIMRKMVVLVAMLLLVTPTLVFANEAAMSQGKAGGTASAASLKTGGIALGAFAVATVGAVALSNGGDGSSSSGTTSVVSEEQYTAIGNALNALDETGNTALKSVMEQATTAEAQATLVAIKEAVSAGLTQAQIEQAYVDAGGKANPFVEGSVGYTLYENLVSHYRDLIAANPTYAAEIKELFKQIPADALDYVAAVIPESVGEGFDNVVEVFKKDLDEIAAEVIANTDITVVDTTTNHTTTTDHTTTAHH